MRGSRWGRSCEWAAGRPGFVSSRRPSLTQHTFQVTNQTSLVVAARCARGSTANFGGAALI